MNADTALVRLKEGNERYRAGAGIVRNHATRREEVATVQAPFAVILSCADSRVPPELIFDQGVGDLFVIRVAGNMADTSQLGSIEFAVTQLGVSLVVVLGHSCCGAVQAALGRGSLPDHLSKLVDHVRANLSSVTVSDGQAIDIQKAVRHHTLCEARAIPQRSAALASWQKRGLCVVAAEYDLDSGQVTYL